MNMPILRPISIPTNNVPWWKRPFFWATHPRTWEVVEDFEFLWKYYILVVPKGFVFDGASVPRILWPLLSPMGILMIPGLFHDFAYKYNCYLSKKDNVICEKAGKKFFDRNFYQMGKKVNGMSPQDWLAWVGLFIGGGIAWNNHRKENCNVRRDYPGYTK